MNFRKYLIILAVFLVTVLVVQPALSAGNMTDLSASDITSVVTNHTAANVTNTIVTDYTPELTNDTANNFYNYGTQSLNLGDNITAIKFFDQALAENTTMLKKTDALLYLYQNKAYAQIQLEKYNDAIATLDAGLAIYPKDAMLWNNKGYALSLLGKTQDALTAYDTSISLNSTYTKAYINQGDLLVQMGRYSEAVTAYTRANETDPFNIAAYDGLEAAKKGEAGSSQTMIIILVVVLIAAIGIVVWYVKFRKPSSPAPEQKKAKFKKK
jgi:tetratricopeptide (TPR) repeat protein